MRNNANERHITDFHIYYAAVPVWCMGLLVFLLAATSHSSCSQCLKTASRAMTPTSPVRNHILRSSHCYKTSKGCMPQRVSHRPATLAGQSLSLPTRHPDTQGS